MSDARYEMICERNRRLQGECRMKWRRRLLEGAPPKTQVGSAGAVGLFTKGPNFKSWNPVAGMIWYS